MNTVDTYNFAGKKAIIRVDFNVPLNDAFEVTDDTRIRAAIPTIQKILKDGGSAILMSHLGRPKKGPEDKYSLRHIVYKIEELLGQKIAFATDCVGSEAEGKVASMKAGDVLLLENLRFHAEEEKGDKAFAQQLANLADCYVNDAFGTAHRAHASTTIVADFFPNDKMFGYLIAGELISIDKLLENPESPYTAIIGGAKVSSKITIIERLLKKVDNILIGGGMAYTFIKAKGGTVGNSLVEDDYLDMALSILKMAAENNVTVYLPEDSVVADAFSNDANTKTVASSEIPAGWMGLDMGPKASAQYREVLLRSKSILWNGPAGVFEMEKFKTGTVDLCKAVVDATAKGAFSLVGGGDSVAAVNQFDAADKVSYVSTGGGALLEYMEGIELPGIAAIRKK